ncbi:hypothetical protein P12x_005069 [Tundrisphaera lichenicola]|uniref:hypothetical protein n=1 Tax=Tundrisphaera lichenicola TaxID=2029860 RepID=UPI003EBDA2A4
MRLPRIRFTIGRLMVFVVLAGLASWSAYLLMAMSEQSIPEQKALAEHSRARLTREVAEYALREYTEGVFKQDLAAIDGEIAMSKSDLERMTDRTKWSDDMIRKGRVLKASNPTDHLMMLNKARFELEQSRTKREVLLKYTRDKTIKELQAEIQKARSDERARLAAYQSERSNRWRRILGF